MTRQPRIDFSPRAFLKARRPERFSDSVHEGVTELDRSLLEYHLASVTSRSQETEFARFAHRLCEKEICPNLLPQTGPTGGGDSKVDAETYPVADKLALGWYEGVGRSASEERWAFAFSAKEDWAPKCRSDIAKLVATSRGYAKAFFVTNQAVPDRKRAAEEDVLRAKYKIDVRILDRSWILNRVFAGRHEGIAIEELRLTAFLRRTLIKGPLDTRRERDLEQTETRIQQTLSEGKLGVALVEDALEAAILSRSLERSHAETIGRFGRAMELALRHGSLRHQVEAAYQLASTKYWWFEDVPGFAEVYSQVEEFARESRNPYDLERLETLWQLLHGLVSRGLLDEKSCTLPSRTKLLVTALKRLRDEKDRPSAALQAEALLCNIGLVRHLASKQSVDGYLRSLKSIVQRSKGLIGFPLEPLIEIITEMGKLIGETSSYADLFETVVSVVSEREGEVRGARLLLQRGEEQLEQQRPVDAIATLGRALARLYKHEARHDLVRALYLCGCAYDEIGLPWAARGTILHAASVATDELWLYGDVTLAQASCFRRLKWLELQMGRIPHVLAWHELDVTVRRQLVDKGHQHEKMFEAEAAFQALLGRLLLRTDFGDLRSLGAVPPVLDNLGLHIAADALLFALGYEERVRQQVATVHGPATTDADVDQFASDWANASSDEKVASRPEFYDSQVITLVSHATGCRVNVECEAERPCVDVGESVLAALESFVSTSAFKQALPFESELSVTVRRSDFIEDQITYQVRERAGRPYVEIRCQAFDPHALPIDRQQVVRQKVFEIATVALSKVVHFKNAKKDLLFLFRDERVGDRAGGFTASFGTLSNILGVTPKTSIAEWIADCRDDFPLRRRTPWRPTDTLRPADIGGNDPASRTIARDFRQQSHASMKVVSVIRIPLWDRAHWNGTAYATSVRPSQHVPTMGLLFGNPEVGAEIFACWRQEMGEEDKEGRLRVLLIRGIDKAQPHAYRVAIGAEIASMERESEYTLFSSIYRMCRMDPATSENLDRFIAAQKNVGEFYLVPGYARRNADGNYAVEFASSLGIKVRKVHVRDAWEIGPNDIDRVVVSAKDDPIVPKDVKRAPVHELLRQRGEKS